MNNGFPFRVWFSFEMVLNCLMCFSTAVWRCPILQVYFALFHVLSIFSQFMLFLNWLTARFLHFYQCGFVSILSHNLFLNLAVVIFVPLFSQNFLFTGFMKKFWFPIEDDLWHFYLCGWGIVHIPLLMKSSQVFGCFPSVVRRPFLVFNNYGLFLISLNVKVAHLCMSMPASHMWFKKCVNLLISYCTISVPWNESLQGMFFSK